MLMLAMSRLRLPLPSKILDLAVTSIDALISSQSSMIRWIAGTNGETLKLQLLASMSNIESNTVPNLWLPILEAIFEKGVSANLLLGVSYPAQFMMLANTLESAYADFCIRTIFANIQQDTIDDVTRVYNDVLSRCTVRIPLDEWGGSKFTIVAALRGADSLLQRKDQIILDQINAGLCEKYQQEFNGLYNDVRRLLTWYRLPNSYLESTITTVDQALIILSKAFEEKKLESYTAANKDDNDWAQRQLSMAVGRMLTLAPNAAELFYMQAANKLLSFISVTFEDPAVMANTSISAKFARVVAKYGPEMVVSFLKKDPSIAFQALANSVLDMVSYDAPGAPEIIRILEDITGRPSLAKYNYCVRQLNDALLTDSPSAFNDVVYDNPEIQYFLPLLMAPIVGGVAKLAKKFLGGIFGKKKKKKKKNKQAAIDAQNAAAMQQQMQMQQAMQMQPQMMTPQPQQASGGEMTAIGTISDPQAGSDEMIEVVDQGSDNDYYDDKDDHRGRKRHGGHDYYDSDARYRSAETGIIWDNLP